MTFARQIGEIANAANNRLALALDAETEAEREKRKALEEQRQVMSALRSVMPDHYESTRGETLANRAGDELS